MDFSHLPDLVYNSILDYLPDKSVNGLSVASKTTNAGVTSIKSRDYYWLRRIADILEVDLASVVVPEDITTEAVYNTVKKIGRSQSLIRWLTEGNDSGLLEDVTMLACKTELARYLLSKKALYNHNTVLSTMPDPPPDAKATMYELKDMHVDLSRVIPKPEVTHFRRFTSEGDDRRIELIHEGADLTDLEYYDVHILKPSTPMSADEAVVFEHVLRSSFETIESNGSVKLTMMPQGQHHETSTFAMIKDTTRSSLRDMITSHRAAYSACKASGRTIVGNSSMGALQNRHFFVNLLSAWVCGIDALNRPDPNSNHNLIEQVFDAATTPIQFIRECQQYVDVSPADVEALF